MVDRRKKVIERGAKKLASFCLMSFALTSPAVAIDPCDETVVSQIRTDPGHRWRPPFGLDRVGKPLKAVVEVTSEKRPLREYWLSGQLNRKEIERRSLRLLRRKGASPPWSDEVTFDKYPAEVALFAKCGFDGEPVELAREAIPWPALEADVIARPEELRNPVDLGTVLVPAGWLVLGDGQKASVDFAAISYAEDIPGARVAAWYASAPQRKAEDNVELAKRRRVQIRLPLPLPSRNVDRDILHVNITDGAGNELWQKKIRTMLVWKPPHWPEFGVTETKLRYDAPISIRDRTTAELSSMDYEGAWAPHLKDVVVSLPNGSRFVFWRGASYVPFWAGQHNTGLSYEWAETRPPPGGFVDSVEPLMDKELRYGRVKVMESTAARVHVRWTYQANDFTYKVFGDAVVEDFYFYPDGFGTRVLALRSAPDALYELSEFIILTSQGTYPLEVFPSVPVKALFLDGYTREQPFPVLGDYVGNFVAKKPGDRYSGWDIGKRREVPAVYRVSIHKDDDSTAIYFSPHPDHPRIVFAPFFDRGYLVTPAYWGSHWPLARGMTSGSAIEQRIYLSPAHNSLMSFATNRPIRPTPIHIAQIESLDTLGQPKTMTVRQWVWLIGMNDLSDARLLEWAHSFTRPPSLDLKGARLDFDGYISERRAIRLVVEDSSVLITIKPLAKCVNPVFELRGMTGDLAVVTLGRRALQPSEYAWDGRTLWLKADIENVEQLRLDFSNTSR